MQSISKWLSYLKFRASYGQVGNDGIVSTPRFVFLPTIERASTKYQDPQPGGGMNYYRYLISAYTNNDIQWEIAEQLNFGVETKMFGGIWNLTLECISGNTP